VQHATLSVMEVVVVGGEGLCFVFIFILGAFTIATTPP
jgi:hypothetical protein